MHTSSRITALGWTPVKGCTWLAASSLNITGHGIEQDRRWTPITHQLRAVKATDVPELAGVRVLPEDLPAASAGLVMPDEQTVMYYDRPFTATIHDSPMARRLSDAAGEPLWLAHTTGPTGFIWSSPLSVLLLSELDEAGLPIDVARYRANIVLDDLAAPLQLEPGAHVALPGGVELEVERPLDRCRVIDHNPADGQRDQQLLPRLRDGLLLGWGCRVPCPGTLSVT
ncbi:hypothetical protein AAEX63_09720 [Luteococcus sp. H138]|uniref:MOSC domain-containing protein n=1 Tax=unclassified Luteococcus TaxID=2639923 RepID=UPI00313E9B71